MKRLAWLSCMALAAAVTWPATCHAQPSHVRSGHSIWDGVYSRAQAQRGAQIYQQFCSHCHGGASARHGSLWGPEFWHNWRESTLRSFFDYIRDNMPNYEPGELEDADYIDIMAFVLSRNQLPAGARELTPKGTVGVAIVAKSGPGKLPDSTAVMVGGCLERTAAGAWSLIRAGAPKRVNADEPPPKVVTVGVHRFPLRFVIEPLDPLVGHTVEVTGLLMGDGGVNGINLVSATSVAGRCASGS